MSKSKREPKGKGLNRDALVEVKPLKPWPNPPPKKVPTPQPVQKPNPNQPPKED